MTSPYMINGILYKDEIMNKCLSLYKFITEKNLLYKIQFDFKESKFSHDIKKIIHETLLGNDTTNQLEQIHVINDKKMIVAVQELIEKSKKLWDNELFQDVELQVNEDTWKVECIHIIISFLFFNINPIHKIW